MGFTCDRETPHPGPLAPCRCVDGADRELTRRPQNSQMTAPTPCSLALMVSESARSSLPRGRRGCAPAGQQEGGLSADTHKQVSRNDSACSSRDPPIARTARPKSPLRIACVVHWRAVSCIAGLTQVQSQPAVEGRAAQSCERLSSNRPTRADRLLTNLRHATGGSGWEHAASG